MEQETLIHRFSITFICRFTGILLLSLLFASTSSAANCGYLPTPPSALEENQLTLDQISVLETAVETYIAQVDGYMACLDEAIGSLAPADATEAFYESAEYQTRFDALRSQITVAEAQKITALERHNYLLENAAEQ